MSERLLRHGASSQLNHPNLTDISQATDRPPTVLSPVPLLFPFLCRLSPCAAVATRAPLRRPTNHPPVSLPACGACFPIPHSTVVVVVVVARTLREKVTSWSRFSQDPANPSWYKIAPSGSQCLRRRRRRRHRSRRNASEREMSGNWDSVWIGTIRYRRLRGMLVVDGHCGAATQRRSTNASRVGESPTVEAQ